MRSIITALMLLVVGCNQLSGAADLKFVDKAESDTPSTADSATETDTDTDTDTDTQDAGENAETDKDR